MMQTNEVEIFVDFSEQTEEICEKCKEECTSLEQMLDRGGVRYRHSFSSRLIQAEDALKQSYSQIKNLLLSFSGVRCRLSQSAESFKLARVHLSRLNVKGKALVVELALDPSGFDAEKYHFEDNSAHCAELPMRMRVRSPRSLRYCLELIGEQMRRMGLVTDESYEFVDFAPPYETSEELIGRGLIKVIEPTAEEAAEACIEDAPLLLNDAPIDAPSALDPIFVLSDAPFTDDTEVSDGCSERCTEPSDPIIVESDDGALNGEAICERREPSSEDTRVSVGGLRELYPLVQDDAESEEPCDSDIVLLPDEQEQIILEVDLDGAELSFGVSEAEILRAQGEMPYTPSSSGYYPPYYGAYPSSYGAPYGGAYAQPPYAGYFPAETPYSVPASAPSHTVESSYASAVNTPSRAADATPRTPSPAVGTDALQVQDSAPRREYAPEYSAPTPPSPSDDPLTAALNAALYSSDVASAAALSQAQRCGFDEMFHESWLEEE